MGIVTVRCMCADRTGVKSHVVMLKGRHCRQQSRFGLLVEVQPGNPSPNSFKRVTFRKRAY